MPGLTLNSQPSNVTFNSTPLFQDWSFSPDEIQIDHYQGETLPDPVIVNTRIKDVLGTNAVTGLTNIRYRTYMSVLSAHPVVIIMSGPLHTGTGIYAPYEENGMVGDMTYTFQNLNLLSPNTYHYRGYHQIYGTNINGTPVLIAEAVVNIRIRVFSSVVPTFSPANFNYTLISGQSVNPGTNFTINGTNWVVRCPAGFTFSLPNGFTVVNLPGGGQEASGTGEKTITLFANHIIANNYENDLYAPALNPLQFELIINGEVLIIPIRVTILNEAGLFMSKDSLHFISYKGIQDDPGEIVKIFHTHHPSLQIIPPVWLYMFLFNPFPNNYLVRPVSSENLEPGIYTGNINISSATQSLGIIPVILEVIEMVRNPYVNKPFAFTLDRVFLDFAADNDKVYYELDVNATVYDFFTNVATQHSLPFKIVLFQRRQKFNLGLIIDRLMKRMNDFLYEDASPYKMADVNLVVRQKRFDDPEHLLIIEVDPISFIAGLTPQMYSNNGFLDINPEARRITPNSFVYINMVLEDAMVLRTYKNDVQVGVVNLSSGIKSIKVIFAQYEAQPGDVFKFRLENIYSGFGVEKFCKVFPEGDYSNMIIWEDEYKLKQAYEFTGQHQVKSEFENRSQNLYQDLVEVVTKIENTKINTLTINTGYILKSDVPTIESLMRAKRAGIKFGNKIINLVPVSKSLINSDTDTELIAFDVEFEINRQYNEEVHSF